MFLNKKEILITVYFLFKGRGRKERVVERRFFYNMLKERDGEREIE